MELDDDELRETRKNFFSKREDLEDYYSVFDDKILEKYKKERTEENE